MLSSRTQLAVWAYAACMPTKIIKPPVTPKPSFSVKELSANKPLHFVEVDPVLFEAPASPYAQRDGRVINWFFVAQKTARKHYMAILDADPADVPDQAAERAHGLVVARLGRKGPLLLESAGVVQLG